MRWEYNCFSLQQFNDLLSKDGIERFDKMGKEGWELVGQVGSFVFFKRCFKIETVYDENFYSWSSSERIIYPHEQE